MEIEYRINRVTRYEVLRYEMNDNGSGMSRQLGEYGNEHMAFEVGYALAKKEHDDLGWPMGDERIKYPVYDPPNTLPES